MQSHIFTKQQNVLGLDLGTTNSVVTAWIPDGMPKVLNSKSGATTPSCVMFNDDGSVVIGRVPYKERHLSNVVYSFKKFMGTENKLYKDYTPRTVASIFVKKLLEEVKELNPEYSNYNAIQVSVPAYFDINQIEDTKRALEEAGYVVVGVNNEPTAAALLYQQVKRIQGDILVFDLGGGTFDAVLVRIDSGIPQDSREFYKSLDVVLPHTESVIEILDVSGDNHLGGDDIDTIAADLFIKEHNLNPSREEYQKILKCAESVKKLGVGQTVEFCGKKLDWSLVEQATREVSRRCIDIVDSMLQRGKSFNVSCVLCGGSTKSNIIREELGKKFTINVDIDPDLAVGIGDSIKYHLDNNETGTSVVNRLAKGVGVLSGDRVRYLAKKGTIVPLRTKFVARNAEPFSSFVNIDLYQGDGLSPDTHISTITLDNIKGHDRQGYAEITIDLSITSDGTISVAVSSGDASVSSTLVLASEETKQEELEVHPDAKFYYKFLKGVERYQDAKLKEMVDQYRETGSKDLAKQIMFYQGQLANCTV